MTDNSKIEWTDASWNPVRGCGIVSKGCKNCYAMKQAHRFSGPGKAYEGLTMMSNGGPVWNGKITLVPKLLDQPLRWKRGRKIFVNSMSDLFHESVPFEFIAGVFAIMSVTTRHTYQILTKRPERMVEFFEWVHEDSDPGDFNADDKIFEHWPKDIPWEGYDNCGPAYPYENVWLGVSVEDQKSADERIPLLLKTPAAVRWISAEPLLEEINIRPGLGLTFDDVQVEMPRLNWGVVGGESGPGARPFVLGHGKDVVRQFKAAGLPVFVKQVGSYPTNREGELCLHITDPKGGDMSEWPEELRVREYPR